MLSQSKGLIERHVKTHTERSAEDAAAVTTLESFLNSEGKINCSFSYNDKWPNIDGYFEFVPNPDLSRRPIQNFVVQIKGVHGCIEKKGIIKYDLKSLAFPAFVALNVTLDPGILFVVFDPDIRGKKRVFWKYMSAQFINSIDFKKDSTVIYFDLSEEIRDTDESVNYFCKKLESIVLHHSFVSKLSETDLCKIEIDRIILKCNKIITETIDLLDYTGFTRDDVSNRILPRLYDLCRSALLLNSLSLGNERTNLQLAWEQALLSINTKYLATFLRGLKYIEDKEPEDGQSERMMLKYYDFMWQIREFLHNKYGINILDNLEKFPLNTDILDDEYNKLVAEAIKNVNFVYQNVWGSRFYVIKKVPFYVEKSRYYEITLQLADVYATKYNRITVYAVEDIATNYSVQIACVDTSINLWGVRSNIKVITNWQVSIEPAALNKLLKILHIPGNLSSRHGEYNSLMDFMTRSGINLLDFIDFNEATFTEKVNEIYSQTNTYIFMEALKKLKYLYSNTSSKFGRITVRYLLINLREDTLVNVLPWGSSPKVLSNELFLSKKCYSFEVMPFICSLPGGITNRSSNLTNIRAAAVDKKYETIRPYLRLRDRTNQTGEIFSDINLIASRDDIDKYNNQLNDWERNNGFMINIIDRYVSIDHYEKTTVYILEKLISFSKTGNPGQKEYNQAYLKKCNMNFEDGIKELALKKAFVNSKVLLIYGAAGTGKTTLINYLSNLMSNQKKLFLTKTHTAKQNLQRRIDNPGCDSKFTSIDSFTRTDKSSEYDVVFVDECSIIDNRTMQKFLEKIDPNTFLVLAGDIHQIESIDFGNWFLYAKELIKSDGSNIELMNTWRTKDPNIVSLWDEVRIRGALITEKLAIGGSFSENIGEKIFEKLDDDEVILCLNYDGKFGLNNINSYFQSKNDCGEPITWKEWIYKAGDHILFNESKRFPLLYNNLKGKIIKIEKTEEDISFTIDVDTNLTKQACDKEKIEFISAQDGLTRIRFTVYANDDSNDDDNVRMCSVIPFQLAYAVSIHKAQGLEYNSVKIIIPKSNSEKINHGIFYTAITRAKKKLKIFWSAEIMNEIVKSFGEEDTIHQSLEIIREKLL